jgi:hypothetical protein
MGFNLLWTCILRAALAVDRQRSCQVRGLLALNEIKIDLSADARHLRATSKSIPPDLDVLEERVFVRTVRQKYLEKTGSDSSRSNRAST